MRVENQKKKSINGVMLKMGWNSRANGIGHRIYQGKSCPSFSLAHSDYR